MQIKWWQSKVTWAGIVTTLLGILPVLAVFLKLIEPVWAITIDGALVMLTGVLTVIWRVWFTSQPISATPPTMPDPTAVPVLPSQFQPLFDAIVGIAQALGKVQFVQPAPVAPPEPTPTVAVTQPLTPSGTTAPVVNVTPIPASMVQPAVPDTLPPAAG